MWLKESGLMDEATAEEGTELYWFDLTGLNGNPMSNNFHKTSLLNSNELETFGTRKRILQKKNRGT